MVRVGNLFRGCIAPSRRGESPSTDQKAEITCSAVAAARSLGEKKDAVRSVLC